MKRNFPVLLLFAVVIGATMGFFLRGQFAIGRKVTGTPILRDLSFTEFIASVGSYEWHVVEDRVYDAFPPLSRSPRIARRIVAQSTIPISEQESFAKHFQTASEEWITSHGAEVKGASSASRTSTYGVGDGQVSTLVDLPRRFYAKDKIHGAADFGSVVESGRVTVIISIIEGD